MDKEKIDLNKPAFGVGAQKIEEATSEIVVEPVVVPEEPKVTVPAPLDEETVVPYRRFKKFHDRALEAERLADEWRSKAEAINDRQPVAPVINPQDEAYKLWLENFGDNEASRKAWVNQLKITQTLEERAMERAEKRALDAVRNERYEEVIRTEENIETLDENFEDLSAFVGRGLTEKEQSAILDIVDDYTPKDRDGNYDGRILPFEKAWEIYELRTQASKAPAQAQRNAVAGLSGNPTQGEVTITEKDKNFNPLDWNAYQKRI